MKDTTIIINIADDFSPFPAGRHLNDGPYSGEGFLKQKLVPALQQAGKIKIILDGTLGYGSSFLEAAFGGLVRLKRWDLQELEQRIEFVSETDFNLIPEIKSYMHHEAERLGN